MVQAKGPLQRVMAEGHGGKHMEACRKCWPAIGTTYQGKGRVSREVRIDQAGRGRAQGGEEPMGAATYEGKWFKTSAAVSGQRPVGTASCITTNPPPPRE